MGKPNSPLFAYPKCRQLLAVVAALWLGLVAVIGVASTVGISEAALKDPLISPFFYLALFGCCSLWVLWQYRRRAIDLPTLLGAWPQRPKLLSLVGLWGLLFIFSLGAFQVSYGLLSYLFPNYVSITLQDSLFLGAGETAVPWLYNLSIAFVLVVAAPILEEFLFRGFLLHRWGTRWNLPAAVLLSSILFGILHGNVIGLTMFGLIMALLYCRTGSLWAVIAVHALNNAIAASLEIITRLAGSTAPASLADLRSNIWFGIVLLGISLPFLLKFIRRNWPQKQTPLPYFINRDSRSTSGDGRM
ncbi:MAG: type II CAAX endopeptidase family protein [Cyanobacteria bacterium P01_H01_bin.153]